MQCVVYPGADYCFALHEDGVNLRGLYGAQTLRPPTADGKEGPPVQMPAAEIVQTPPGFVFAYDDYRRPMDPRRFAGQGGTPLQPGGKIVPSSTVPDNTPHSPVTFQPPKDPLPDLSKPPEPETPPPDKAA